MIAETMRAFLKMMTIKKVSNLKCRWAPAQKYFAAIWHAMKMGGAVGCIKMVMQWEIVPYHGDMEEGGNLTIEKLRMMPGRKIMGYIQSSRVGIFRLSIGMPISPFI